MTYIEARARELASLFWRMHPAAIGAETREEYYARNIGAALAEAARAEREECAVWVSPNTKHNPPSLRLTIREAIIAWRDDEHKSSDSIAVWIMERFAAAIRARSATQGEGEPAEKQLDKWAGQLARGESAGSAPQPASIVGDEFVIRAPLSSLSIAAPIAWESRSTNELTVTDLSAFAKAVLSELRREKENGDTLVTDMLDAAIIRAIEDGAEGYTLKDRCHGARCDVGPTEPANMKHEGDRSATQGEGK